MVVSVADPKAVRTAHDVLSRGGIAVLPTDTIYGFSGAAPETAERIRALKGRGEDKPFLMLLGDPEWIRPWSDFRIPESLRSFWPGPLTLILPGRTPGEKHAFRLPDHSFLSEVLALIGRPLYSTSVNWSGESILWKIDEIVEQFEAKTDLIVAAGDRPGGTPSTVLDLSTRPYTLIRQGEIIIPGNLLS